MATFLDQNRFQWREYLNMIANIFSNVSSFSFLPNISVANEILFCKFFVIQDRLCGLVVRVLGYRSGGPGSIPCTTRKKSSGYGTGFTQPREYN
jgi:hypothetical protein